MPFPIKITLHETRPAGVAVRAHRQVLRDAYEAAGRFWCREFLPRHFQAGAGRRYDYAPRRGIRRKLRDAARGRAIEGGVIDLVWTGALRRDVLGRQGVRGFPTRVTISLFGPSYFGIHRRPGKIDLAREVTAVIAPEQQALEQTLAAAYRDGLARFAEPRTKHI